MAMFRLRFETRSNFTVAGILSFYKYLKAFFEWKYVATQGFGIHLMIQCILVTNCDKKVV